MTVDIETTLPNIFVLGVGHSGTTVLSRMLGELGWNTAAFDDPWGECPTIRELNHRYLTDGVFDFDSAVTQLSAMKQPWAIKDPRFVATLHHWKPAALCFRAMPTVIWLSREKKETAKSYIAREEFTTAGEPGIYGYSLSDLIEMATQQFEEWPGPKLHLKYEQLTSAAALFREQSAQGQ